MGQYYNVVIKNKNTITAYNREVDGEYTMAKLTEHSWWYNPFVSSITKLLYKNPCQVAWIGDYSKEINQTLFEFAWEDEVEKHSIHQDEMYLDGKYLVNHTIGAYLDCDKYKARCNNNGWILHPLPLLTAVGNGLVVEIIMASIKIKLAVGLGVQYPLKMIFRLDMKNLNIYSEKIKTALLKRNINE